MMILIIGTGIGTGPAPALGGAHRHRYRHRQKLCNRCITNNYSTCGKTYSIDNFKILRQCNTNFQLTVCEAVMILTLEPTLCIQQKFDFTTSLI